MNLNAIPILLGLVTASFGVHLNQAATDGPYHVTKSVKAGGEGGFDYVYADSSGRKLYVARGGSQARVSAYNLDSLDLISEIAGVSARGAAADASSGHAFASSKPVAMWDSKTLTVIKKIDVDGRPDGILNDDFNHRTYIFSHSAPNVTVIDDNDGTVLGTIDLGAAPEQAASDGRGTIFVDLEDKDSVAVIDAKTMKVTTTYGLGGKGGGNAGLALDARHHVLFVACHEPQVMVMLDSRTGKILADLPIGNGVDGAVFNPKTGEAFASTGDGQLTIIKETNPTTFVVEQVLKTMRGAKTLTLDSKTGAVILIAAEYAAPAPGSRRGAMTPGSFTILAVNK